MLKARLIVIQEVGTQALRFNGFGFDGFVRRPLRDYRPDGFKDLSESYGILEFKNFNEFSGGF